MSAQFSAPEASGLFDALVDDAGLFPPTSLPMDQALERHRRDQERAHPVLTHRFLCPASRLDSLRRSEPVPDRIGLIVDTPELPDYSDLPVDFVETRTPGLRPPAGVRLFLEVPPDEPVTGLPDGAGLKVRCGGLTADAFPTVEHLGAFIRFCVDNDIPFKATAGLHHAVRHFDPSLGVDRHGFLNLVLGVCEAVEGRDPVTVLRTTDVGYLVRLALAVPEETTKRARQLLVSYGSCSTSTPIEDLTTLGVI
ncbi:hypothetical protein ACIBHX_38845 [Nonomuraea sp. NPDC050536]|uniref:hypothetical protein n=1 Tax=Nonomuraea sp. NPDC050536 TaxID=3364366 RepID=UPI0037C68619